MGFVVSQVPKCEDVIELNSEEPGAPIICCSWGPAPPAPAWLHPLPATILSQRPLIAKNAMNGAQLLRLSAILMSGPPAPKSRFWDLEFGDTRKATAGPSTKFGAKTRQTSLRMTAYKALNFNDARSYCGLAGCNGCACGRSSRLCDPTSMASPSASGNSCCCGFTDS